MTMSQGEFLDLLQDRILLFCNIGLLNCSDFSTQLHPTYNYFVENIANILAIKDTLLFTL